MSLQDDARSLYNEHFFAQPAMLLRVPGRVVLAGDFADMSNLPVLGLAVDRDLVVAAGESSEAGVQVVSAGFEGVARIDFGSHSAHGWSKYIEAALAEIGTTPNRGAKLAVVSEIPSAGGFASSAAFMTGIVAALNAVWALGLGREQAAQVAARAERRLAFETSGVDHLLVTSTEAGHALRIDPLPFAERPVGVPEDWAIIVAAPPAAANRAEAARRAMNERIVGTRMAAAMLAEMIGLDPNQTLILSDVSDTDVIDLLVEELPVKQTIKEVARATEVLPARLGQLSHSQFETQVPVPVRGPAMHVLSEALRVSELEAAMRAGDGKVAGAVLVESHTSLRDGWGASTGAINEIVKSMGKAGAWGAKAMGYQGQALALASRQSADAVMQAALAAGAQSATIVRAVNGWERL